METERLNRLQELSKGSEILNVELPAINVAELMRQTRRKERSEPWEVYARINVSPEITQIKKFTWSEEGGRITVVEKRGDNYETYEYSFESGARSFGEGYLQIERPSDYRPYIKDIEMIGYGPLVRPSTSPGLAQVYENWMSEVTPEEPQPAEPVQTESQEVQQSGSQELQMALDENERLKSEIEAKDQQIAGLQSQLDMANAKIENLENAVRGLQEQARIAEEEREKQAKELAILIAAAKSRKKDKDDEESGNPDVQSEPESPIPVQIETEITPEAKDDQVPDEGSKPQELSPGEVLILGKLAENEGRVNVLFERMDEQDKRMDDLPRVVAGLVAAEVSKNHSDANGVNQPERIPGPEPALSTSADGGNGSSDIDSDMPVPEPAGLAVAVAAQEPVEPVFPGSDSLANVEPTLNGSENGRLENRNGSGRNKRGWFVSPKDGLTKRDRSIEGNGSTNDKMETKARTLTPRRVIVVDRNTVTIPGELSKYITPANVNKILGNGKVTATEAEEQFRKLAASKAVESGQEWKEEALAEELAGIKVSIPVSANR